MWGAGEEPTEGDARKQSTVQRCELQGKQRMRRVRDMAREETREGEGEGHVKEHYLP